MTLPIGKKSGFTLLEVLITLAIIALFSSAFLLRFDDGRSEELLREASVELEAIALLAKKRSHAFRQDQLIYLRGRDVFLYEGIKVATDADSSLSDATEEPYYTIPSEIEVEIRSIGETRWRPLRDHSWLFRKSGLNEELQIRFSIGRSYSQLSFSALSGRAEEEIFID